MVVLGVSLQIRLVYKIVHTEPERPEFRASISVCLSIQAIANILNSE